MLGTSFQLCKSELSFDAAVEEEVVELAYFFEPPIFSKIGRFLSKVAVAA